MGGKAKGRCAHVNKSCFLMVTSWGFQRPGHAFALLGHEVWLVGNIPSCPSLFAPCHCQAVSDPVWSEMSGVML